MCKPLILPCCYQLKVLYLVTDSLPFTYRAFLFYTHFSPVRIYHIFP
jgi:hypothetical protein